MELKAANGKLARTTKWLEEEKARADALLYRMSGLLAVCFPGQDGPRSGPNTDAAAAVAAAGASIAASLGGGGNFLLQGSEDSGTPADSVAAVAALLRQAGVRAPTVYGDSTMMLGGAPSDTGELVNNPRSRKAYAIDRIEAVRRELDKANINVGETDNISCCELLVRALPCSDFMATSWHVCHPPAYVLAALAATGIGRQLQAMAACMLLLCRPHNPAT